MKDRETRERYKIINRQFTDWAFKDSLRNALREITTKSLINKASISIHGYRGGIDENALRYYGWKILTESDYKTAINLTDNEWSAKKEVERARIEEIRSRPTPILDIAPLWIVGILFAVAALFIIWRVAVGVSAVGQMQSSPGDRACEQLGGRPSGDSCRFR